MILCEDLGNDVDNGTVEYSPSIVEPEGRYKQGTTATVTCDAGFRDGGVITCEQSGEWSSPSLPTCEPGESSKKYIYVAFFQVSCCDNYSVSNST